MRIRKMTLIVMLVLLVAAGAFLVSRQEQEKVISYEPSDYGIPDEIAGYQVLAVMPGDSNPCQPDDEITVVLNYVNATTGTGAVYAVLNEIDPDIHWTLNLVGATTREYVIERMNWIHMIAKEGCTQLGPQPLPTNTPHQQY